jgi:hypothetical protein
VGTFLVLSLEPTLLQNSDYFRWSKWRILALAHSSQPNLTYRKFSTFDMSTERHAWSRRLVTPTFIAGVVCSGRMQQTLLGSLQQGVGEPAPGIALHASQLDIITAFVSSGPAAHWLAKSRRAQLETIATESLLSVDGRASALA